MPKPEAYKLTGQETGRPTIYKPEYCETIVRMAKEGRGPAEWGAEFDIGRATLYRWRDDQPAFRDAWTRAELYLQAWWENAGRIGMVSDKFNSAVWAKNMSCRFQSDWREQTENKHTLEAGQSLVGLLGKVAVESVFPKADDATEE